MTVAKLKGSLHDRVTALEQRSEAHDKVIPPMAIQVEELYEAWTSLKTINWFVVKITGGAVATLGGVAVLLTIIDKASQLTGHH